MPDSRFHEIKRILREQRLHTVCEEASCPNIAECFGNGTATFMILGDICTRRCPFCDVAHGRPLAPDAEEPRHLAETQQTEVVPASHHQRGPRRPARMAALAFVDCIRAVRAQSPRLRSRFGAGFRGRPERALDVPCGTARRNETQLETPACTAGTPWR
jgi:lipoic acid synthetase